MDIFEAIYGRSSIRSFRDEPFPKEHLTKILEAAVQAPSAGNLQTWVFIVVDDKTIKHKLSVAALDQWFIEEAPIVIVVCADVRRSASVYRIRGERLYCIQDTAASTMIIALAAYSLGLSTCWVGAFDESLVRRIIEAPDHIRPVAIVPLGYPAEFPRKPSRRSLREVVRFNKW